jgi:hypothetical protein
MRLDCLRGAVGATTGPLQSVLPSVNDIAVEGLAAVRIPGVAEVPAAVEGPAIVVKA